MVLTEKKQRLLIIYPYTKNFTNWTLMLLVERFESLGLLVDVAMPEPEDAHSPWYTKLAARLVFRGMAHSLFNRIFSLVTSNRYAIVLGVDPDGIKLADLVCKRFGIPLVYVSFEIMAQEDVCGHVEETAKRAEIAACAHAHFALVQDDERADLFCRSNNFPRDKVINVPVSPPPITVMRNDYLRRKLNLAPDIKIVLFAGDSAHWSGVTHLDELVGYWPENYRLVLHSYVSRDARWAAYFEKLSENPRILLSPDGVLDAAELLEVTASADFGLALYTPIPDSWLTYSNLFHLGLASGKFSSYALCGLPILASSLPTFRKLFSEYTCGKTFDRASETGNLLVEMDAQYDLYSAESKRLYAERLNPTSGINEFCSKVMSLVANDVTLRV